MNKNMINCLGLCIVFGLTTTNCSVSNDIEQSPTPEQPKVAKYHNPIVSTSLPDPTVTKADDGYFYLYATENIRNLPIYRSKDLVNWNYVGTAFTDRSRPQWNPQGGIWAPDINVVNGRYMLYYSKSEWGGEWTCGIGIASATSPQGPFIDHGALFISQDIGIQNCIDPFYIELVHHVAFQQALITS
jgi:arabinan endo-1,5-alpha-L-arabinosidase